MLTLEAQLVSINVAPGSASIPLGNHQQFLATGSYSDGTSKDLSTQVSWSSSAGTVASIDSTGLAATAGQGSTVITATLGSVSGSASLTVTAAALVSIAVTPDPATVPLGTLQQFTATGTYTDSTSKDMTSSASWASSNHGTATITSAGVATAQGTGSATITATSGVIFGNATLTVNTANVVSLSLTPANPQIADGTNQQLTATATFDDGGTLKVTTSTGVHWTSSDTSVATVGVASGLASGKNPGDTLITVTFAGFSASATLTVSDASIQAISLTPTNSSIAPGTTEEFTATGTFSDGTSQALNTVSNWSSDKVAVATVGNSSGTYGTATGVSHGTANISAKFTSPSGPSAIGTTSLEVSGATLVSIAVTPAGASTPPGGTVQYNATGTFSDSTTQLLTTGITWLSSDTTVATVDQNGLSTAIASGTSDITAASGLINGSSTLTVTSSNLVSIAVTCASAQVAQATSENCTATGTYDDSSTQTLTKLVHWTSSASSIATVNNTTGFSGVVTAGSPGSALLTAYMGGIVGTYTLTVTNASLTSISVIPNNPSISLGTNKTFTATGSFSDGTTQSLSSFVTWASSDAGVAIISNSGIATSAGVGATIISGTLNGVSGTTTLTVH
jgi:hypothetical protein